MTLLPAHFYSLQAQMPDGHIRWRDDYADAAPSVIQFRDLNEGYQKSKARRNQSYSMWQAAFFRRAPLGAFVPLFKPKMLLWQAIQVVTSEHSERNSRDWWPRYQDAIFRVFVNPETITDRTTGEYKQWYLLSPEDCYMVNRYEVEREGASLPPRDYLGQERYLSADRRLRRARFIPVECCRHWRHETTAGKLPEDL